MPTFARKSKHRIADPAADKVFFALNTLVLALFLIIIAYPIYFLIIASVSDIFAVNRGEVLFWPVGFRLDGYIKLFTGENILLGYRNTLFYTIVGTSINIVMTMTAGYALSIKFPGRRVAAFLITFTMFFSGGIIPTYFVIRDLGLLNNVWVMLLPGAVSAYNLIIARTFISGNIPAEIYEAASIDGCNRARFFLLIVVPLSGVLVSILTLFYAVGHWNSYFNAMMYLDKPSMYPLQLIAREILINNKFNVTDSIDPELLARQDQLRDLVKYALIVVISVPMLILYPFLQRYFVKGVMIGAIKG